MKKIISIRSLLITFLLVILSSGVVIGYSYWENLTRESNESILLGEWWDLGTPISTPQEFYDVVTSLDSDVSDNYYLTQDIDFNDFDWEYNNEVDDVVFKGTLNGMNHTIGNLTIYTNDSSHAYFGLFPKLSGGTLENIVFDNFILDLGSNAWSYANMTTGLIAGTVSQEETTISNITIINSEVRGSSNDGTGGLVGQVDGSDTVLNINNIKTTSLKVFSKNSNIGGLIGLISSNSSMVHIQDVDVQVEVNSSNSTSYSGGIVGKIASGATFDLNRAIIEMTTQNTIEDAFNTLNEYTGRYIGGVIGYNLSNNVTLNDTFFTGELVEESSRFFSYTGTLFGRNSGSYSNTSTYYANVLYRSWRGTLTYNPFYVLGINASVVDNDEMPTTTWWNDFSENFGDLWNQSDDGRLYLIR